MLADDGRRRVVIERVTPQLDGGAFAIKRVSGEAVVVEADVFADGHDLITVLLRHHSDAEQVWHEQEMQPLGNDRWQATFIAGELGYASYYVAGYVDHFKSWARDMAKRIAADSVAPLDLEIGARLVDAAAERAQGEAAAQLRRYAQALRAGAASASAEPDLAALMHRHGDKPFVSESPVLRVKVDRELAAFSSWYEIFPRSTSPEPGRHGTFKDVENWLPYVKELGFDILYLTPIHPIGQTFRKGKDNNPTAEPHEPGSPYAIGGPEGGHKDVHPELGTLADFRHLVAAARAQGIEIALDNAFQVSPEHPYVARHPEWFRQRPDGTIQYAENPPKKYQDIYPINFESDDWQSLWQELKSYFDFWIAQGVTIFRVDNPHTKSFPFWAWCIDEINRAHPEVIFLSEAFTRPKVMYRLAKLGFTQSYTYFTWRTTKWELIEYLTELTQTEAIEFFRPNFWPTTHDILTPQFYDGHRATFIARLTLAATMVASYGIYGPAYEHMLHTPVAGREEHRDNEKYELKHWDLDAPHSLRSFVARLNQIRRENPALQRNESIRFHSVQNDYAENEQLVAYSKRSPDGQNIVLIVVNLDPINKQSGWIGLAALGLAGDIVAHDLLTGARYHWSGQWNYVQLEPVDTPVHIFRLEQPYSEQQFDNYG